MEREKPFNISLTGTDSHQIEIPPGQGSFSIGLIGMDRKKFDILVDNTLPVNWSALNGLYTPHGQQNADKYPNGDWPRFFYYWGNDKGFVEWSKKRCIEDFFWHPNQSASIDLSNAQIRNLSISADEHLIKLVLVKQDNSQPGLKTLALSGNIHNFEIIAHHTDPYLRLNPSILKSRSEPPYQLPVFKSLAAITSLDIIVEPLGQPFDCQSLLQFPSLIHLNLTGNITNTGFLKELSYLERLGIRYAPNLEGLPSLHSWAHLKSFIGWNIEETTGKRLNTELKLLAKEKELDYSSVSKLRSAVWFTTEYGIPFENWEGRSATIATKAYKNALKTVSKAKTQAEVRDAITGMVKLLNTLPNMETVEREDTGVAISQLIDASSLNISRETGSEWFDEARDF